MAGAFAITGRCPSTASSSAWIHELSNGYRTPIAKMKKKKNRNMRLMCVVSSSSADPYKILKIRPDASEFEIKTAFRRLALQYHPDVCRGSNCTVQFHQINDAYHIAMDNLRGATKTNVVEESCEAYDCDDEPLRGMDDPDWDMWEEWMGWEGAGIRDYSSHINPYI